MKPPLKYDINIIMNKDLYNTLFQISSQYMEKDRLFHDVSHVKSVIKNAKKLIEKVGGDELIILTTLLFHDIRRDVDNHEKIGADETREILRSIEQFPSSNIEEVCISIERHEKGQVTHNEKVVSDSDKIDAFSINGIGRGFMMLAKKEFTLKTAIQAYLDLLEKWSQEFHFEESRTIVNNDYKRVKALLIEMQSKY